MNRQFNYFHLSIISHFYQEFKKVFKKGGPLKKIESWSFGKETLQIVSQYKYLGFNFTSIINMQTTVQGICLKGKRALYDFLKTVYSIGNVTYDIYFKVFDIKIKPIVTYGAEIWGCKQFEVLERIQSTACKRFLNVS